MLILKRNEHVIANFVSFPYKIYFSLHLRTWHMSCHFLNNAKLDSFPFSLHLTSLNYRNLFSNFSWLRQKRERPRTRFAGVRRRPPSSCCIVFNTRNYVVAEARVEFVYPVRTHFVALLRLEYTVPYRLAFFSRIFVGSLCTWVGFS